MRKNEQGLVGILVAAAVAVAGATGGSVYVEKQRETNETINSAMSSARESIEQAKVEATEDLPVINPGIISILNNESNYATFNSLVDMAGMRDLLASNAFTVFAPTEEAFAKLPEGAVDELAGNPERLQRVLSYHIIPAAYDTRRLSGVDTLPTVLGDSLGVKSAGGRVQVNGANLIEADTRTANGYIHSIDTVLMPAE